MKTTSKFRIALVNNADQRNPEHWHPKVSVRRSRAIQLARKLRKLGNPHIILLEDTVDEMGKPTIRRISILPPELKEYYGGRHHGTAIAGNTIEVPRKLSLAHLKQGA